MNNDVCVNDRLSLHTLVVEMAWKKLARRCHCGVRPQATAKPRLQQQPFEVCVYSQSLYAVITSSELVCTHAVTVLRQLQPTLMNHHQQYAEH